MGYGNPDSSISCKKQLESGELAAEVDGAAEEFIISGEGIVEVQEHDDGCIDGCETSELYVTEGGEFYTKPADNSNHERAKVAGGGYITSQAMRLGVGRRGDSIDSDLALVGSDLAEKEIYCGAHSGAHQHGEGTDCGANDKFALILENGLKFREQIEASTGALVQAAGLEFHPEVLERVLATQAAASEAAETAIYAGVAYQVATAATLTDGTLKMFAYTQA